MDLDRLRKTLASESGRDLRELLVAERNLMDNISRKKITAFNFFGSIIEILATQKAIAKIDKILNKLGVPRELSSIDPRDSME